MTLLLYIHVLALVYWLGGDLGTFLASRYITRSDLGIEARKTAFAILQECDLGPKLAMPLTLGSGFHLTVLYWPPLFPQGSPGLVWLVVMIWLGLVWTQHVSHGANPILPRVDLVLRYGIVAGVIALAVMGWQQDLPDHVALKMLVFAGLVACGIAVRFALRPFAMAYLKMVSDGASPETDLAMVRHLAHCRRYVWLIWIGLFINTALGLRLLSV